MRPILLIVPVCELLGLIGFMLLASNPDHSGLRWLPLFASAILVILLLAREAGSMTLRQVAVSTALLSLLGVAAFQTLGLAFSGLAKDVDLISLTNAVRLGVVLGIALAAHGGVLVIFHLLRGPCRNSGSGPKSKAHLT
ncbi:MULTISPECIES: hypothetical protein [Roseateles]|uniref:Uncharacterized protein n=1 Tax=Pelomonas caseinilytica TaxID=2906763 RepID=A0ABS8XAG1_9BURK|nr:MULTISPECIES: hypothetical protein [unclassified Roseateles]MCE4536302.1 hypothetical protein [Pelomonas sp. P7]HEV6966689.1 hypothetical protein [Roseateles sp.]